jgi:hypothetical protein
MQDQQFYSSLMNIPNLPTDNLYKFMAISGLFVFILSMFYPVYREIELKHRWIILSGEMRVLQLEYDNWEWLQKHADISILTPSDPNILKLPKNEKAVAQFKEFQKKLDVHKSELRELLQYRKALANLESQQKQLDTLESEIKMYKWFCWVGVICGIVLILLGFKLWYSRVQRFQDILLYREATKSDQEPSKNGESP